MLLPLQNFCAGSTWNDFGAPAAVIKTKSKKSDGAKKFKSENTGTSYLVKFVKKVDKELISLVRQLGRAAGRHFQPDRKTYPKNIN